MPALDRDRRPTLPECASATHSNLSTVRLTPGERNGRVSVGTLIRAISAVRPKVADYAFTTLTPHLGVVSCGGGRSFVAADVPGLIPGAHRGEGLGDRFLRHLLRTRLLLHLVDLSGLAGEDPLIVTESIDRELALFDATLAALPRIVVGNKIDLAESRANLARVEDALRRRGAEFRAISAAVRKHSAVEPIR